MILVTGATGKTGGATARALRAAGVPVRALVRDRKKAAHLDRLGVTLAEGDLGRPESLQAACDGVDGVLLVSTATPETPRLEGNLVQAAARAQVRHLVKIGAYGTSPASPFNLARWHAEVERTIAGSGIAWTNLHPHYFMENFLMFHAGSIRAEGRFYAPMRDGRIPMIDTADIGEVAARCLTSSGHEGKTYDLTGPAALSHGEAAAVLSKVLGRTITYVDVPSGAAAESMRSHGMPAWLVEGLTALFEVYASGAAARVSPEAGRILGRPPRTFEAFVREHAGAFARA
jgi:uncharacterized protein YbjT (DUF2867 family)